MLCLTATLISGCVSGGRGPAVIDTSCDWVHPIYLTAHNISVMSSAAKRAILTHNEAWQSHCQH